MVKDSDNIRTKPKLCSSKESKKILIQAIKKEERKHFLQRIEVYSTRFIIDRNGYPVTIQCPAHDFKDSSTIHWSVWINHPAE